MHTNTNLVLANNGTKLYESDYITLSCNPGDALFVDNSWYDKIIKSKCSNGDVNWDVKNNAQVVKATEHDKIECRTIYDIPKLAQAGNVDADHSADHKHKPKIP